MFEFSKKDIAKKAEVPERPRFMYDREPYDQAEERGSKPISKHDPEFDFLTRLIKLLAKEGVPPEEIKAVVDANAPLETIDQAGDIAAQLWTLATEKYKISRDWLIKMLPDTKTKKACLQIKADQYDETDPEWPSQNAAEDFSDRPTNSVAYAPEKQSKPMGPKKQYVTPPLGIGPQNPGNEDAGHGFFDSPGPADLGKNPKGDFPSNEWMPMGTEDMDAEYWDNVAALSKKELNKVANPDSRYWVAPDGTEFPVAGVHGAWIKQNAKILQQYGIKVDDNLYNTWLRMKQAGWVRVSNEPSGSGFQIEVNDISKLPSFIDDVVAKHFTEGDTILVGDADAQGVQVTEPFPSLQRAVNKARRQQVTSSLKKADVGGNVINNILMLLQANGGVTYNLQQGNLAGTNMFAVSIYPDREQIQDLGNFEDIENFIEANKDLLEDPSNSFGAWANEGKVYYDVVATVPDEEQALELGRKHNQLAIFDLKNGMEIKTGVERFSFSKKERVIQASLEKWALARQDVIDFYLLSLIPMDYLLRESKNNSGGYDGLAIFKTIVQQLRDEYITRGMRELVEEAKTTRWITKIPDNKMPEQLKPYYKFHDTGYPASTGRSYDDEVRYPWTCAACQKGLHEDNVFTYGDNNYCESCEMNIVDNDISEYVKYCKDDNKFVCPSEYADQLEGFMPSDQLDDENKHEGHDLIPYSEGSSMWSEVLDNANKQLKIRFPREPKSEEKSTGPKTPPTSAAFPEASLKTAGEGEYGVGGPYWEAPKQFNNLTAEDFYNIFEYAPWSQSYGGPAWAEIARTIGKMQQTTDLSSLIVLIDHYHDLGHNTGKLLDKFPEWRAWFKDLLDMKAQPGSLRKLLSGASRPVRDLVVEYFKVHGRPEALESALYKRICKKADDSPLTQEQQDEIAASSSPVYNIALNNFFEAFKRGHGKDRSFAYAVDSVKNLEKIDPKKLVEFANTYLQGLI